jgi:uncharacterized protein
LQKTITIKIAPSEAGHEAGMKRALANELSVNVSEITGYEINKRSLDARGRQAWYQLSVKVFINEPFQPTVFILPELKDVSRARSKVVIIGAGPAGLFAALKLIELGIKPIIIERGKDVRARRRDLAVMNKEGIVNPESNYCFGEGGAGTYSDGKLYTRSTKRGNLQRILNILVHFGADEKILYDSHPHIGTNKLPHIITSMREKIVECGGDVLFGKKFTGFDIKNESVTSIRTADGDKIVADAFILATGHSARDVFRVFDENKLAIEFKPFALGVRVEHPQSLIDSVQYHCESRGELLPPAAYSLVQQVDGKGVFSFCMCPGGIIAPAATAPGEIVVNGWSPSKRNNPFANSGIVVNIEEKEIARYKKYGALAGMMFQQEVEQKAYKAGGGKLAAPAQRLVDFSNGKTSSSLPSCSYLPGIHSVDLNDVLPGFVHRALQDAFKEFGKKMKGYFTNDAVAVATESRTSSPVRIIRDRDLLHHPQLKNLYPCAEGAGYAGGIISAAMDGERVADIIAVKN